MRSTGRPRGRQLPRRRAVTTGVAIAAIVLAAAGCHDKATTANGFPTGPPLNGSGSVAGGSSSWYPAPSAIGSPPEVAVHPPPAPTGPTETVPAAVASNCATDVAPALQAWIDAAPDNSTLSFGSNACYRVDETLVVADRTRLLFDGHGATLKAVTTGKRGRAQLALRGGSDLTVRDLIVKGANPQAGATPAAYHPDLEAQHAFVVAGASHVLLDHVQATDTYGDFVYIGTGKNPSDDVTVANSRFERSGRQGISITSATNVTIEANTIAGAARSLFDVEPNIVSAVVRNLRIVGNVTGAAVNFWFANKGVPTSIGNITISGNTEQAATGGLLFVFARRGDPRGPYVIENNHLIANDAVTDEGATGAFFFTLANDITITGNDVVFPPGRNQPAVELRDAHHVRVSGNQFHGAGRTILASAGSSDYQ